MAYKSVAFVSLFVCSFLLLIIISGFLITITIENKRKINKYKTKILMELYKEAFNRTKERKRKQSIFTLFLQCIVKIFSSIVVVGEDRVRFGSEKN